VLHFPGMGKQDAFNKALQRKVSAKDWNFRGVWFPEFIAFSGGSIASTLDLIGAIFTAPVSFEGEFRNRIILNGARFQDIATFGETIFQQQVSVRNAHFQDSPLFTRLSSRSILVLIQLRFTALPLSKLSLRASLSDNPNLSARLPFPQHPSLTPISLRHSSTLWLLLDMPTSKGPASSTGRPLMGTPILRGRSLNWLLSGYGERVQRAFWILVLIWALFTGIYWTANASWWEPKQSAATTITAAKSLSLLESSIYSANVMALQKPQPLPANKRAKGLVLAETILGPVQAALLALAIRRKFMR
jgi:hypothetical protein